MRGVSTVVDATVFLLLVSAAILTVTIPVSDPPDTEVAAAADTLATSTAAVEYRITVPPDLYDTDQPVSSNRTANGTLARLVADATVSNATLSGQSLRLQGTAFRVGVANATRRVLRWVDGGIRVEAAWTPYRGAPLAGRFGVGATADDTDTTVASLTVPGPVRSARQRAIARADAGFHAVAATVANATVDGLLPPTRMRLALQSGGLPRGLAVARYYSLARALETGVGDAVEEGEAHEANDRLATALARRFARDMRRQFSDPTSAARHVRADAVRIVVRGSRA